MNNDKKRDVAAMIRFVSLPFEEHEYFYRQEYEQKCGCIWLRTYDEKEYSDCIKNE